jgi:hypothetical protein
MPARSRRAASSRVAVAVALSALAALGALAASGCEGERITSPLGHGVIRLPSTSIRVGESVTVVAGVQYDDGRFVSFAEQGSSVEYRSSDATKLTINSSTGHASAVAPGTVTITAIVPQLTVLDTSVTVVQ